MVRSERTCSTLENPPTYLRACDHGMGVEAQVQDCLTVMQQSVEHLSRVHVPHPTGVVSMHSTQLPVVALQCCHYIVPNYVNYNANTHV